MGKISEFIERLQEAQKTYGDVEVNFYDDREWYGTPDPGFQFHEDIRLLEIGP